MVQCAIHKLIMNITPTLVWRMCHSYINHQYKCKYKCKMCMLIVWYPLSTADFIIYTPGIRTFSYSFISSGKNSAFAHFAAAIAILHNLAFLSHLVPVTVGWTEVAWYERLAQDLIFNQIVFLRWKLTAQPARDEIPLCCVEIDG